MGTELVVLAPDAAPDAGRIVQETFGEWDRLFSRFRPDSELSSVNAAAGRAVPVSGTFFQVVTAAVDAAHSTGGLFDPTLLGPLVDLGYDRTFADLPPQRPPTVTGTRRAGGWREIQLDASRRTVRLPTGVGLDLGGIAKGMAVDAAIERLEATGSRPAAVSAGGDLAVSGTPTGAEAWSIELTEIEGHPVVDLPAGALATSSVMQRRWRMGVVERHHLIDPRTGSPAASGVRCVSVVAPDCRRAEVAAKTALLLGPMRGASFLESRGLSGVLCTDAGLVELVGGWRNAFAATLVAGRAG